jgi:hypothetical protein
MFWRISPYFIWESDMPNEQLADRLSAQTNRSSIRLRPQKPTIRILLYTDEAAVTDDTVADWGLGVMIAHIRARLSAFFTLCIDLVNRNADPQHPTRLYSALINKYDQIWFFGVHQTKLKSFSMGVLRGGPQSELDDKEVAALERWMCVGDKKGMKGGGVLMTGDHANPPPTAGTTPVCGPGAQHESYLGLGRALGHRVPRAGQLRKWEGPPTTCPEDSYNTLVLHFGTNPHGAGLEIDAVPQQLILPTFNELGQPTQDPTGQPHALFLYKFGEFIRVFPDHVHEGAVVLPKTFENWPKGAGGTPPKPQIVAHGIDKRNARLLDVVAAYNGDDARVGRIVADSTWHHYFNKNLNLFLPVGEENSAADLIGTYYANLVLWLSPKQARFAMASVMIDWLSHHPTIFEEAGFHNPDSAVEVKIAEALRIGRSAFHLLSEVASQCEIHELLQVLIPESDREQPESIYLPDFAITLSYLPSKELFLGTLVGLYRQKLALLESAGDEKKSGDDVMQEVVAVGFKEALSMQFFRLSAAAANALDLNSQMLRKEIGKNGVL